MTNGVVEIPLIGPPLENDVAPSHSSVGSFALPQFVAGPENQLIELAVTAVLQEPSSAFNPVVLYGASGSGKTHLSNGIYRTWKTRYPRRPAVLITAIDFAREYRESLETKTDDQFLVPYSRTQFLVVENVDELSGRWAAQQAFTILLDRLLADQVWIVVTSKAPPSRLTGFQEALYARLMSGLTIHLALPSVETRLRILQRVALLRRLEIDDRVLQLLADRLAVPVPELIGALVQLEGEARLQATNISLPAAQRLLAQRRAARQPSLPQIAKATAKYFAVSVADLRGPSRRRAFVNARNVAMYLARNLTENSLERIGAYFGNRDHATVAHGCRKLEERLRSEPVIRDAVAELGMKLVLRG